MMGKWPFVLSPPQHSPVEHRTQAAVCVCVTLRVRPDGLQRRQDGNMRRLTADDDDDDNATWNGNSTQQM